MYKFIVLFLSLSAMAAQNEYSLGNSLAIVETEKFGINSKLWIDSESNINIQIYETDKSLISLASSQALNLSIVIDENDVIAINIPKQLNGVFNDVPPTLRVNLPTDFFKQIKATTKSGNILLLGLSNQTDISRDIDLNNKNGSITVQDVAGNINVKATNGRVLADRNRGDINVVTDGDYALVNNQSSGEVNVRSRHGNIYLFNPAVLSEKVYAYNGNVYIDNIKQLSGCFYRFRDF